MDDSRGDCICEGQYGGWLRVQVRKGLKKKAFQDNRPSCTIGYQREQAVESELAGSETRAQLDRIVENNVKTGIVRYNAREHRDKQNKKKTQEGVGDVGRGKLTKGVSRGLDMIDDHMSNNKGRKMKWEQRGTDSTLMFLGQSSRR